MAKLTIPFRDQNAAALAASANSVEFNVAQGNKMILYLNCTTVTGSPTLAIAIQDRDPMVDPTSANAWHTVAGAAFTNVTATGKQRIVISDFSEDMRMAYTITGSTSLVFTLVGVLITP